MINRRSIFKCIPAMIAAAVLPKAWTARASEPSVGHVTLHEGMIRSNTSQSILMSDSMAEYWGDPAMNAYDALIGETGPEFIMPVSGTIKRITWSMDGPIRIYVDDEYGGTADLARAISAEFTIK